MFIKIYVLLILDGFIQYFFGYNIIGIPYTENRVSSFFKRLQWIGFNHGDSKSSNFFLYQGKLFVFDLDVAKKRFLSFQIKNKILKDQKRILKSFDTETNTRQALIKRFN